MSARSWILAVTLVVIAAIGGWIGRTLVEDDASAPATRAGAGPCAGGAQALYWKAPMDPSYVRDTPGKSPMGMDLVPVCPDGAAQGESGIAVEPSLVQSMGVRMAPVERRDLSRSVRAVARVAYDERLVDHVHTKIQGWIERLYVEYEGELVKHGQPLLEIYSPELVSTQEELLLAARYRDSTRGSGFEDVARGGEDLYRATRRRLELWDVSSRDIDRLLETGEVRKNITLYAPTQGVVTDLMVRAGMEVGPNHNLYTIADLSHVWLYADVYEYELPWVREGQKASVDLSYLPGRTFEGEVTYVYPFLDPKARTARVRVELDNPDLLFKPDMYANVTIQGEVRQDVLAIPEEAVIRSGRRTLAVVATGEGRFESRELGLGIDSGDGWIEVRSGLAEGDRVVTSSQFLIDSESKLQEAIQKMLSAKSGEDMDHTGHPMPESATPNDPHAGHATPEAPETADPHAGHSMQPAEGDLDPHAGHAMPATETNVDPHAGHSLPGHEED